MPAAYSLRPITGQDLEFLYQVYASTRIEELAVVPWTPEQKEAFLRQQFDAQHRHYTVQFSDAAFDVVEVAGRPAGRLYLHRRPSELRIIDIALLPEYRRQGLGTAILSGILDEARRLGRPVTIHVEHNNPAFHLYTRLGFRQIEDQGVYLLMQWQVQGTL